MIPTFFSTRKRVRTRAWAIAGAIALLACGGRNVLAQSSTQNTDNPGFREHGAVHPPLLFREVWKQPPHTGPLNDDNRRITPEALTNADLEYRLYGTDSKNVQVTEHNGVPDLWTGWATSPVALTLRHKGAYLDLTGLTRMRCENPHRESACAASGREARGREAPGRQSDDFEPAEADDRTQCLFRQFRGVRSDV